MTLQIENLRVDRANSEVLHGVDLTVRAGEIVALVGSNGAGKTSLLDALSGVVPLKSGKISINSESILRESRGGRLKRGLLYIEQGGSVFGSLTVKENLLVGKAPPARLDSAVSLFPELEKRWEISAGLLSGGEKQMLALARAVLLDPDYLLIDEMSLGLAPVVTLRLMKALRGIAQSGAGVLMVEQFARLAIRNSDRTIILLRGRVHWEGPSGWLAENPAVLEQGYLS